MNGNSSFLGNLTIGSSATASEALEVIGTASGRILYATQTLRSSGSLVWEGSASGASLWVSQFQGAGLITTCDPTTGKLTWNSTTKSFVCGTDSGTSYTAGQGLTLSSTVFSLSPSFSGTALKILGTASGRILHAQDQLRSSGSLIVQSTGLFKGNLSTRGTLSGAALTVMNGNSYILGNFSIGTSASPDTALEVAGTMSGRTLTWAGGRSALDSGQGGNIELGGNGSVANPVTNGSPYIDFHFGNGSAEDYNTRIWNPADDRFDIINSNGGMIVLNDMRVGINTATPDTTLEIIGTASGRKLFAMDSLASSGNLVVSSLWKLGSGAIAALGAEYQTGAYLYASGASVLALESYTQNLYGGQHLAPNILFGYKGVFDTNLYRTSGSTLRTDAQFLITTSGSNVNRPSLLIDTETATGSRTVFLIKSNATSVDNRVFRINASGATFADQPYSSAGADYAEWFYDSGSLWGAQPLRSGEIVCIDIARNNAVRRCDKDADSNVMGIISTRPAFIGNHIGGADGVIPPGYVLVGLIGQLPAKALVASGATIRPGDALTAASIPGYARRARAGEPTVGVALEGLDVGEGTINVLVARTNSSLTVDAVEDKVLQTVAAMEIEDEIALAVNEAMNALDLESSVAAELQAQFSTLDLASRVETIVSRLDRQAGPDAELVSRFTALESVVQGLSGALVSLTSDAQMIQTADHSAAPTSFSGVTLSGRTEITGELIINGVPYGAAEPIAIASSDATQFVRIGTGGVVDLSALTVREALYVLGDVTIEGMAVFRGDVTIEGSLTLSGSLTVSGAIVMNSNQAGFALIPQGGTGVTVGFDPPFAENLSPVITVTSDSFSPHRLRASSATGFTIEVQQPAVAPIVFSWHALVTSDVRTHAGAPAIAFRLIPFPVDSLGVPLSSNTVWNACIRNQVQLDQDGQPFSCGRYHVDNIWTHPDLTIEFLWRPDLMPPLSLPEGFVETVVVSEERAEESAPVAPETLLDEATVIESSEAPAQGARGDHGADPEAQPSETDISPEDSVSSEDPAATTEDALSEQATDAPVEPATADEVAPSAEDAPLE
jgi:uncharacterized protein YlzI (FlbEa/FlbD family)